MKNTRLAILGLLAGGVALTSCLKEDPNPAEGTPNPFASVGVVQAIYKGQEVKLGKDRMMGAYKIGGVVISNAMGNNLPAGHVIIQNTNRGDTRGMVINLGESAGVNYAVGDSLVIEVEGSVLTRENGVLQIKGLTPSHVLKAGENRPVKTRAVALGELATNFEKYENTLVKVNADITPTPEPGETYSGDKVMDDGAGNTFVLQTSSSATFANNRLPASAQFTGIAFGLNGSGQQAAPHLRLRTISDVANASGPIYTGFPEDFESPDASTKSSYNMAAIDNNVDLKTGNWKLYQAILGVTPGRDRFNAPGKQCVRMQQNLSVPALVQMNFDLPNGASKVTIWYGSYYTDASSSWILEYSTDSGETWTQTGPVISDAGPQSKNATFLMDITGPVRFRVAKLGLGPTNGDIVQNGRLSIEDFAIYQN
ncbi:MAG: DUF5689 domain-containing protein [Hymenobacteraceae bacterium]|nr:DUF5689 domain-containing protein [Hymenobacteraceae bacterium]